MPDIVDSIPWDQLLTDIHKRQVLPIVGPGLVTVNEGGKEVPLIDAIVPDFACEHGIDYKFGMTLNDAACKLLERDGQAKRMAIYNSVTRLIAEHSRAPVSQGLVDLTAITDFDAIITTTFDGLLTRALEQTRPGWTKERGRARLNPNDVRDLPDQLPGTFLYHILGCAEQDLSFAIWEEDYMEYLAALMMGPKDNLRNLIGLLRNRSLLLIGSPFRNWFVRFFLFVAKRSSIALRNDSTGAYLAEDRSPDDPLVFYFNKVIGSPQVLQMAPSAFVAELSRRWNQKHAAAPLAQITELPQNMPRGTVFISYASEDRDAAFSLAIGLHNAGIPVWLDKVQLQAGSNWEDALRIAIKNRAALFLSLISATTEGFSDEQAARRVVLKERYWAAIRHEPSLTFYVPVLISPGVTSQQREPEVFRRLQCAKLPGGHVDEPFIKRIAAYMEEYREKGEIAHVP